MSAKTRFIIGQWSIVAVSVALSATAVALGITYTYLDDLSIAWTVIAGIVPLAIGGNVYLAYRLSIGNILTRRCDVSGYESVYRFLYGKSHRASVEHDRVYEECCIQFYQGQFEEIISLPARISEKEFRNYSELIVYVAYAAYQVGNEKVLRFAAEEMTQSDVCSKKRGLIDEMSAGAVQYCLAMNEGRAEDARIVFPPRTYKRVDRYFQCFSRYCFSEAERALGNSLVADRVLGEVAQCGTLWFAQRARERLAATPQ